MARGEGDTVGPRTRFLWLRWEAGMWLSTLMRALYRIQIGFIWAVGVGLLCLQVGIRPEWLKKWIVPVGAWWFMVVVVYRMLALLVGRRESPALPIGIEKDVNSLLDELMDKRERARTRPQGKETGQAAAAPKGEANPGGKAPAGGRRRRGADHEDGLNADDREEGDVAGTVEEVAASAAEEHGRSAGALDVAHVRAPDSHPRERGPTERAQPSGDRSESTTRAGADPAREEENAQADREGVQEVVRWVNTLGELTVPQLIMAMRKPKRSVSRWVAIACNEGLIECRGEETRRPWYAKKGCDNRTPYRGSHRFITTEFIVRVAQHRGRSGEMTIKREDLVAPGVRADATIDLGMIGNDARKILYVEGDTGTERASVILDKAESYRQILDGNAGAEVLFVVEDDPSADRIAAILRQKQSELGPVAAAIGAVSVAGMKAGLGQARFKVADGTERGVLAGVPRPSSPRAAVERRSTPKAPPGRNGGHVRVMRAPILDDEVPES